MRGIQLTTSLVRSTSVLALAACLSSPAWAQGPDPAGAGQPQDQAAGTASSDDEIVVTGIRASLQRSSDIRRDGQGIVDAIVAEDIGKFPDSNLAESLQRIPGISINRVNGEGSEVTARGFGGNGTQPRRGTHSQRGPLATTLSR